jgi:hypothetical protein
MLSRVIFRPATTATLRSLRARPLTVTFTTPFARNMSKTLFQAIKEDHEEVRGIRSFRMNRLH